MPLTLNHHVCLGLRGLFAAPLVTNGRSNDDLVVRCRFRTHDERQGDLRFDRVFRFSNRRIGRPSGYLRVGRRRNAQLCDLAQIRPSVAELPTHLTNSKAHARPLPALGAGDALASRSWHQFYSTSSSGASRSSSVGLAPWRYPRTRWAFRAALRMVVAAVGSWMVAVTLIRPRHVGHCCKSMANVRWRRSCQSRRPAPA